MSIRFVDELDGVVGWIEREKMRRTSHAVAADGKVWLLDPIDGEGVEERVRALGEPAGVIQLLDRHTRDCAAWAERLGVPHHVVPRSLPGTPFTLLPVLRIPRVHVEVALWWPERKLLAVADALGTLAFFRAGDEPVGMHPFLRVTPPRSLRGLGVEHLLVGHGKGVHGQPDAVETAVRTARRRLPRLLVGMPKALRGYG